jgi:hypothetical protein
MGQQRTHRSYGGQPGSKQGACDTYSQRHFQGGLSIVFDKE